MVQSFLKMQLRQDIKNSYQNITRRNIATMVAQRFDRGQHTGRRIIHWEKEWISTRCISETQAGKNKHTLSWMDNKDLVMAVKAWAGEQKDSE